MKKKLASNPKKRTAVPAIRFFIRWQGKGPDLMIMEKNQGQSGNQAE